MSDRGTETGVSLEGYGYQDQVTDSQIRTTQAKGAADDCDQKGSDENLETEEQIETDVTVSDLGAKPKTAYKGTLRNQKDRSSSSESDFSDRDRRPEDKVTDEDDSDAMSDSGKAERRKARKQEKKERKRIAKQERKEQEVSIKRQVELAEAIRRWRETGTAPDFNVYPELDLHSEGAEVYEVSDEKTDEQRQNQEDLETQYQTNPDELIGDEFSDKSSSEETGDEKAEWITNESRAAKKARKAKEKAKAQAKAKQEANAKRAEQAKLQPFERPVQERIQKQPRKSSGDAGFKRPQTPPLFPPQKSGFLFRQKPTERAKYQGPKKQAKYQPYPKASVFANPPSKFSKRGEFQKTRERSGSRTPNSSVRSPAWNKPAQITGGEMPRQMKAYQPQTIPIPLTAQEFARLAQENPEELFRQYSQSMTGSLPIPTTSRQSVAEGQDFSRTMLPGETKFGASMQIGERPIFPREYYKPQAKKYSRTSESDRMQTAATSESETESKRHLKQSRGMTYVKGHVIQTKEPEEKMEIELRRPVLRNTETKLFTNPTIKLDKKGTKIRYFVSCSTGAIALGLPLNEDEGNVTQDVLRLKEKVEFPPLSNVVIFWQIRESELHTVKIRGILRIHTRLMWERLLS